MRAEFSKPVRRAALNRAGMVCEGSGSRYGLPEGVRCNQSLGYGVQFDHDVPDALDGLNDLDNCRAICPGCHKYKTGKNDIPQIRKAARQHDRARGIKSRKGPPMPGTKASGLKKCMDGTVQRRSAVWRFPRTEETFDDDF